MAREIPQGSIEIQTGLYLYEYQKTIGGNTYTFRQLYSHENYCFWDIEDEQNYDEEGNLKSENERLYAQYASLAISMSTWTHEQLNARFISVPIQDGFDILGGGNNHETA